MCSCGVSSQVVQVLPLVFSYGKFPYDSCGISRLFGHRAVSIEASGAVKTKIQNLLKRRVKHRVLLFSQRANPSIRTFFFALNRRTRCLTRLFNKFWIFVLTAPLASMHTALWPNSREMPQESYGNFP